MQKDPPTAIDDFRKTAFFLLISTCLALFIIHILMVFTIFPESFAEGPFYAVHVFFIPLTLIGFHFIAKKFEKNKRSGVKNFMLYVSVKMIGSIVFFLPWIIQESNYLKPIGYQFLMLFFPLLFIETLLLVKLVNIPFGNSAKKSQNST